MAWKGRGLISRSENDYNKSAGPFRRSSHHQPQPKGELPYGPFYLPVGSLPASSRRQPSRKQGEGKEGKYHPSIRGNLGAAGNFRPGLSPGFKGGRLGQSEPAAIHVSPRPASTTSSPPPGFGVRRFIAAFRSSAETRPPLTKRPRREVSRGQTGRPAP